MPKLTIDGQTVEVEKGTTLIEAAKKADIDVPFYCYHPGLSIAGNCRMCLVEVEKMPKLAIACHTVAQDDMVVHTNNERVKETRKHVLEFLLVNHPVDCPVCDQAGECWLQDYYMNYGAYQSRLNENKLKKKKAQPIGPHVMLDQERCILCSRCVRFTDEVSKSHELGITQRGDHSEITVFPGTELDNPYSGNVVDLCPVGALTDRDFRFKMRVWYLKSEDSVCNGCSKGCNVQVHYKTQRSHHAKGERVIRLKPRFNDKINKWWICDDGRYNYKYHDHNRLQAPMRRSSDKVETLTWETAQAELATKFQEAKGNFAVLLSPQLSNEELYLARKFFGEDLRAKYVTLVSPRELGKEDDFLVQADKNPNTKGAELLGLKANDKAVKEIFDACGAGELEGLILFGQDVFGLQSVRLEEKQIESLKWSVFIGSNTNVSSEYAKYVLPSATHFEQEGTFTNCDGITQKFERIFDPLAEAKPVWKMLIDLANEMGFGYAYDDSEDLLKELALKNEAFAGLDYEVLKVQDPTMRQMAVPMIPTLEQDSKLIFYDAEPNQKQNILDVPKAEEVNSK